MGHPKTTPVLSWAHRFSCSHPDYSKSLAGNPTDLILRLKQKDKRTSGLEKHFRGFRRFSASWKFGLDLKSSQAHEECWGILVLSKRIFNKLNHPGRWELEMVLEPQVVLQVIFVVLGPEVLKVLSAPRCKGYFGMVVLVRRHHLVFCGHRIKDLVVIERC